jgi:tocopherol O-methyltransferase
MREKKAEGRSTRKDSEMTVESVPAYYSGKTEAIIDRYGPGPSVHYHIGLFEEGDFPDPAATSNQIRAEMVAGQERLLERATAVWEIEPHTARLLDVGCGLGGTAISLVLNNRAEEVTALTNVPEHAEVIRDLTAAAGVADQVSLQVADIVDLRQTKPYPAAVAIESSCYMPRSEMFQRVADVLEPNGVFGIEDIFVTRPQWCKPFDDYWKTHIGTVPEYRHAAEQAGLTMECDLDVTESSVGFWVTSMAWARAKLDNPTISPNDETRLLSSIKGHSLFLQGWLNRAYEAHILRFRKPG